MALAAATNANEGVTVRPKPFRVVRYSKGRDPITEELDRTELDRFIDTQTDLGSAMRDGIPKERAVARPVDPDSAFGRMAAAVRVAEGEEWEMRLAEARTDTETWICIYRRRSLGKADA